MASTRRRATRRWPWTRFTPPRHTSTIRCFRPSSTIGSTEVAGRSFIAFQISEPVAGGGHRTRRGTMTALAELQIAALECGFAGVHLPASRAETSARGGASRGAASARERVPLRAASRRRRERSRRDSRPKRRGRPSFPRRSAPGRGAVRSARRSPTGWRRRSTCFSRVTSPETRRSRADKTIALSALSPSRSRLDRRPRPTCRGSWSGSACRCALKTARTRSTF